MRRLNREFRGKDKPTDVLSFPAYRNGNHAENQGRRAYTGDIAICTNIARTNAKSLGHSFEDELKILLLHALLHLAGHDHESDNGEMAALEQKLRAKLKLPTGLIERTGRDPLRQQGGAGRQSSGRRGGAKKRGFAAGPALKRKIKSSHPNRRINAGASTQKPKIRTARRSS